MHPDLHNMNLDTLVDMLSQETKKFTQLLAGKEFEKEYQESKDKIKQIQAAIESKKESQAPRTNITFTEPDPALSSPPADNLPTLNQP